jgi:site-specific DNA-methyltransferase (adenine-specific)
MSEINFYNKDNIEFMKTKPDNYYDLAIVDPPYGIDWMAQIQNPNTKANWKKYENKEWDKETPSPEYFKELFRVSKNQIIWGGNYMIENLYSSPCWIIWDKMQEFTGAVFEMAWTSFKSPAKAFRMSRVEAYSKGKIHPTQKPIKLYRWVLDRYADKGNKILDTHGGSMTIAKACDMEGYDLDICEIDKEYFDNGVNEYNEYKKQLTLF